MEDFGWQASSSLFSQSSYKDVSKIAVLSPAECLWLWLNNKLQLEFANRMTWYHSFSKKACFCLESQSTYPVQLRMMLVYVYFKIWEKNVEITWYITTYDKKCTIYTSSVLYILWRGRSYFYLSWDVWFNTHLDFRCCKVDVEIHQLCLKLRFPRTSGINKLGIHFLLHLVAETNRR